MEETRYVFEAKTIQRMEVLVLSTLLWKMHPVTPLSFLDYITRRFGLKNHLCWEFFKRCERVLLSLLSGKPPKPFPSHIDKCPLYVGCLMVHFCVPLLKIVGS